MIAKAISAGKLIWQRDQFLIFSSKITKFCLGKISPRWLGILIQVLLACWLEWIPLLVGVYFLFFFSNMEISLGFQAFLSAGSFASLVLILIWFLASIIESYKRVLLFLVCQKNVFDKDYEKLRMEAAAVEAGEWELLRSPRAARADSTISTGSSSVDYRAEINLWALLSYLCCAASIVPKKMLKKVQFQTKHLWILLLTVIAVLVLSVLGYFRLWEFFLIFFSMALCAFIDFSLQMFVFIPEHKPSFERLQIAWQTSLLQRFVSIIEEVFYHSPKVVFNQSKFLLYATIVILTICLTLKLTDLSFCMFD